MSRTRVVLVCPRLWQQLFGFVVLFFAFVSPVSFEVVFWSQKKRLGGVDGGSRQAFGARGSAQRRGEASYPTDLDDTRNICGNQSELCKGITLLIVQQALRGFAGRGPEGFRRLPPARSLGMRAL